MASWQAALAPGGDVDVIVDEVANLSGQLTTATPQADVFEAALHVELPDTRPCLVAAMHERDGPLALEVVEIEGTEDWSVYADSGREPWLRTVSLQPRLRSLRLRLSGGPAGAGFAVRGFQGPARALLIE
jgi:hypothetical protein